MTPDARTLPTCGACTGSDLAPLHLLAEGRYALYGCRTCGTQSFHDTAPVADTDTSEYWEAFKFDVYGDDAVRSAFEVRYGAMLETAAAHVKPLDSLLDVGCGIGNFVHYAGKSGLRAQGVDVSPRAVAAARQRGLEVHESGDLQERIPDSSLDALTMWDVVEHLLSPYEVLAELVPKVRPGGALLFETPDGAFPVRRVLLALNRWSRGRLDLTGPMYYWEHKIYFTEEGLRQLLDRVGVDVVSVQRRTSVREKMSRDFGLQAAQGSRIRQVLHPLWPALEAVFRFVGRGNKLMVVGVRRPAG
jgi:SAM-dependent methyltransferase